jgi:hypothetical protein
MKRINITTTILCLFISQTFVFSQTTMPDTKWEVGLKSGFDYSLFRKTTWKESVQSGSFNFNGSIYGTRYFNNRWSIRGELGVAPDRFSVDKPKAMLTAGVFPRYRLNRLIDLELGYEMRKSFVTSVPNFSQSVLWAGAAIHLGKVELNLRFAPGYQRKSAFSNGGWFNSFQLGISIPLFKKRYEKKPIISMVDWGVR